MLMNLDALQRHLWNNFIIFLKGWNFDPFKKESTICMPIQVLVKLKLCNKLNEEM